MSLVWDGREDCACGEHVTTADRTWCLEDKEWCYPDAPCRGCELPVLRAEVERLRGVVADAEQAKRAVLKWANSCHHVGCECDNTLADELPDDWMAVAALEEGE